MYVRKRNYYVGNWTVFLARSSAAYLLPLPVRVTSESYVDLPDNAGCYASASPVVLIDTERTRYTDCCTVVATEHLSRQ